MDTPALASELRDIARKLIDLAERLTGESKPVDRLGPWLLDWSNAKAVDAEKTATMTRCEATILRVLIDNRGVIVSRTDLTTVLFGGSCAESRTIDMHIANLRRKLGPDLICTAHSRGYRVS